MNLKGVFSVALVIQVVHKIHFLLKYLIQKKNIEYFQYWSPGANINRNQRQQLLNF